MLSAAPTGATSVVLLDDERMLLETLSFVLSHQGLRVVAACRTASDLVSVLRSEAPDVLIVDLRLSADFDDSGDQAWGLIQLVKMHHPRTRVVILSASRNPADVQRAEQSRVAAFLTKGQVSPDELMQTISRVMNGERIFPMFPLPTAVASSAPPRLGGLTERELEVLRYIGAGYDNLKIAACLGITERTVRAHVSSLYRKLGPENRAQLALLSRELGLRPPDA